MTPEGSKIPRSFSMGKRIRLVEMDMKTGILVGFLVACLSAIGCEEETSTIPWNNCAPHCIEEEPDIQCENAEEGTICKDDKDPTIVARCVIGKCKSFGCDICPRSPCQNLVCVDDICHQYPMPDGRACAGFAEPFSRTGDIGFCIAGRCTGNAQCSTNEDCPSVECVPTTCSVNGTCVGYSTVPGAICELPSGQQGHCFNYTCNPTSVFATLRPTSSE
jgi:hypothetical protein